MRIGKVIGTVTLSRCHPSFNGARLKIVVPMSLEDITTGREPEAEGVVAYDQLLGAGIGSLVAIADGAEASQPFRPDIKPVDVYAAALLDQVDIRVPKNA